MGLNKYITLLNEILLEKDSEKKGKKVFEFTYLVLNGDTEKDEIDELLSELALDIDYYEPDPEVRRSEPCYIGDEKLEEEIKSALEKIEKLRSH